MKIQCIDCQSQSAPQDFARSLRETGFAVLTNHGIDAARIQAIYSAWSEFFAQSDQEKSAFVQAGQRGFFPYLSENAKGAVQKDLKEFFQVYPDAEVPADQEAITRQTYTELSDLGGQLLTWLQAAMPAELQMQLSMPLPDMAKQSPKTMFRILHYPPVDSEYAKAGAIRAAAHEDINLITLLLAGSAPGLQAQDVSGEWHEVSCDPGMIAVNAGDMLQMATDGYFPSTTHRVVNPEGQAAGTPRYSMPIFIHPHSEVELAPGVTADDYLNERLREIGLS